MTKILMKRGTTTPDTNDLDVGEIGLDTSAGKMYFRADNNNIVDVTATGSSGSGSTDLADNEKILLGTGDDFEIFYSGSQAVLKVNDSDKDVVLQVKDGSSVINAMTIDSSNAGRMTINNGLTSTIGGISATSGTVSGKYGDFSGGAAQSGAYPLKAQQTYSTSGGIITSFQGKSGAAQQVQMRNYYSSLQLFHTSNYNGFYFPSSGNYIAPSANAMGYLGDGTVNLGSSSYAWGHIYSRYQLHTQEDETGGFTAPKPAFSCRAWATIQTTGTTTLLKGKGISSVSDIGTGQTQLNFTNTMPDTNYCVTANSHIADNDNNDTTSVSTRKDSYTTSSIQVQVEDVDDGLKDVPKLHVVVHR